MLHGTSCLSAIHSTVNSLYSNSNPQSELLIALPPIQLAIVSSQFTELTITDLLIMAEITSSKNESRRCIESGSIRVDGMKIEDPKTTLYQLCEVARKNGNLKSDKELKISNGKKKHFLVRFGEQ